MDDNPYQSPVHTDPKPERHPLIVAAWSLVGVLVAADLFLSGGIKTFVWVLRLQMYGQLPYGLVALAAGVLVLDRLVRYLWRLPILDLRRPILNAVVWTIILAGVAIEVVSIAIALR